MAIVESGAQVSPSGQPGPQGIPALPIGTILDYGGPTAPSGYLLCYGQAVSRTTYSVLFAVIGTTWGAGDGSTTFNVPDLRGYALAGKDDMGGTDANRLSTMAASTTLGGSGGSQTHTLTTSQLATHGHNHTHNFTCYSNNNENGNYGLAQINAGVPGGVGFNGAVMIYRGGPYSGYIYQDNTQVGGGAAHNNIQPTRIVNKIIFTGVMA